MRVSLGVILLALAVLPWTAQAAPCAGTKRLQLRWSAKTQNASVAFSATQCDRPPACDGTAGRDAGTMFSKSPIAVTIKDASGHVLSGGVDAAAASCSGRCERANRGGCPGGADIHRLGGTFVRYVVNTLGQTTVVANKLKITTTEAPNFVTPVTVTVTDAQGYAVTAELTKCRVRKSADGVTITCA